MLSIMVRPVLVPSSVILTVIALLTLSQFGVSSARSLGFKDGYWSTTGDISKRNSWWSKKSMESAQDYHRPLQGQNSDSPYDDLALETTADREFLPVYSSLFSCYVNECVPQFVQCAKRSAKEHEYEECKRRHELCGLVCGSRSTEEPLI